MPARLAAFLLNRFGVGSACDSRHDVCVPCIGCKTGHTYPGDLCGTCWDAEEAAFYGTTDAPADPLEEDAPVCSHSYWPCECH